MILLVLLVTDELLATCAANERRTNRVVMVVDLALVEIVILILLIHFVYVFVTIIFLGVIWQSSNLVVAKLLHRCLVFAETLDLGHTAGYIGVLLDLMLSERRVLLDLVTLVLDVKGIDFPTLVVDQTLLVSIVRQRSDVLLGSQVSALSHGHRRHR